MGETCLLIWFMIAVFVLFLRLRLVGEIDFMKNGTRRLYVYLSSSRERIFPRLEGVALFMVP